MTRTQRRLHLAAWLVLGPAIVAFILVAWPAGDTDPAAPDSREVSP